jgi:LacI family transcriptional regulator
MEVGLSEIIQFNIKNEQAIENRLVKITGNGTGFHFWRILAILNPDRAGQYPKMTINDIAKKLGISKSTVSRVLQNAWDVNPVTRQRVLDFIKQEHYRPNFVARSLKSSRTNTLGVIIPAFDIPFYSVAIGGIQEEAARRGFNIITCQSKEDYETEVKNIETLMASQVDGLLISLSRNTRTALHLLELRKNRMPVVLFNRVGDLIDFSKVYVDDENGAYTMVTYLLDKGYRRIAHLAGPRNLSLCVNRRKGYERALKERGVGWLEDLIVEGDFTIESGARCMEALLQRQIGPDAVFCVCDSMAIGCMQVLKQKGYRVPGDVAVAGYTNDPVAAFTDPPLTTIAQPMHRIGEEAAGLLIEHILNPDGPRRNIVLGTELIPRASA